MPRLGLTGGIGSGKSTAAAYLVQRGAALIDADAISRAASASGGIAIPALREAFGAEMIRPDGALDRERMRALVFQDAQARQRLEQIIHPLVGQEIARQAEAALTQRPLCLLFDIPLLVESAHWRSRLDRVLVIDCLEETQIARVIARNALSREAVQAILATQASRAQRLVAADLVVFNDSISLDQLHSQLDLALNYVKL